jgi:hypothetical protein
MSDDPQPVAEATQPLDEFCAELSRTDTRLELIAVFRYRELAAGRNHAKPSAYAARYARTGAVPAP